MTISEIEEFYGTEEHGQTRLRRNGKCYLIAGHAIMTGDVPRGTKLVHGSIHPMRQAEPVDHAWLVLPTGMVWEPVGGTVFAPLAWAYMRPEQHNVYGSNDVFEMLTEHEHWGPWPVPQDDEG